MSAPYRCDLPKIGAGTAATGARWSCDCGVVYVVVLVERDGESWREWSREGATP